MKIICIGRNYVAHAKEMESEIPMEPVIFMKPDSALLRNNSPFNIPDWSNEIHYEVELIIKISKSGKNIDSKLSGQFFGQIGLGIDFTARDLQRKLKDKGLPWEKSKAFDQSAVISNTFIEKTELADVDSIKFELKLNGETVQKGDSSLMIFPIEELITEVSRYFTLETDDLIFTGTPEGVGTVKKGDHLEGFLEGVKMFDFLVK
jgi:2-keto-4-pentenoate hydratase/2-oxohepta-3-ene-1,7-dioic acid hydratase in catechol pathway